MARKLKPTILPKDRIVDAFEFKQDINIPISFFYRHFYSAWDARPAEWGGLNNSNITEAERDHFNVTVIAVLVFIQAFRKMKYVGVDDRILTIEIISEKLGISYNICILAIDFLFHESRIMCGSFMHWRDVKEVNEDEDEFGL